MTDIIHELRQRDGDWVCEKAADQIERLRGELEGKISQSYAAELARQVGELEAENERLRAALERADQFIKFGTLGVTP